mmetsp:Transcript_24048/g.51979  ORF Transcript_24048/g.51979 Transcript_24048/m.51979 type:complete len:89 (+) Transcript_24048:1313-1579(+)
MLGRLDASSWWSRVGCNQSVSLSVDRGWMISPEKDRSQRMEVTINRCRFGILRPMMEDPGRPLWHKYDATKTKLKREDLGSDEDKTCQ